MGSMNSRPATSEIQLSNFRLWPAAEVGGSDREPTFNRFSWLVGAEFGQGSPMLALGQQLILLLG
jgi:hypothetical protein